LTSAKTCPPVISEKVQSNEKFISQDTRFYLILIWATRIAFTMQW